MPKQTLQEQFIEGLKKRGEIEETDSKVRRYKVFTRHINGARHGQYYLGPSGSLRAGYTVTGSTPVSSKFKAQLMGIEGTI